MASQPSCAPTSTWTSTSTSTSTVPEEGMLRMPHMAHFPCTAEVGSPAGESSIADEEGMLVKDVVWASSGGRSPGDSASGLALAVEQARSPDLLIRHTRQGSLMDEQAGTLDEEELVGLTYLSDDVARALQRDFHYP
ncbi:MAG: hypothetical protein M1833_000373 [Piccolia ochrophora]|nr:MAG: hypothetical protein M1833_000373 [Piccolia ochrophora]